MLQPPNSTPRISSPTNPVAGEGHTDENGIIQLDLPCRGCGYNIRGLNANHTCPECGGALRHSLRGDLLRFGHPDFVTTLPHGAYWLASGIIAILAANVAIWFVRFMIAATSMTNPQMLWLGPVVMCLISMAASIPAGVGVWWLTVNEVGRDQSGQARWRLITRWTLLAGLLGMSLQSALDPMGMTRVGMMPGRTLSVAPWLLMLPAGGWLLLLVGYFALATHVRYLAERIPSWTIAPQITIIKWLMLPTQLLKAFSVVALAIAFPRLMAAMPPPPAPNATAPAAFTAPQFSTFDAVLMSVGYIGGCLSPLVMFALLVWSTVLLFLLGRLFYRASVEAKTLWSGNVTPVTSSGR